MVWNVKTAGIPRDGINQMDNSLATRLGSQHYPAGQITVSQGTE